MHTKILIRTDSFIEHYQHWLQKDVKDVLETLSGSYANQVFGKGSDDLKHQKNSNSEKIIWHPDYLNHQVFGFLMDLFKTRLIAYAGYQLLISDERSERHDNGLLYNIRRHYLKRKKDNQKFQKLGNSYDFGNLILEHQYDKKTNALIITISFDQVRPEMTFERLMEFLLS